MNSESTEEVKPVSEYPKKEKIKRKLQWTPARKLAFEKCVAARKAAKEKKQEVIEPVIEDKKSDILEQLLRRRKIDHLREESSS